MKVFIAGATGYIGSTVAAKMKAAGHSVIGLARSEHSAVKLSELGYQVHRGDLNDPHSLAKGAVNSDAIIQLAQPQFDPNGDFLAQMAQLGQTTLAAVEAILDAIRGTGKPFILTGGTGAYGDTGAQIVTEETPTFIPPFLEGMAVAERKVLNGAGIRGMGIRPAIVFGRGSGPVAHQLEMARVMGGVFYSGTGDNELSFVHVDDVADLYVLMLEKAPAGTLLNAVSEPFVTQRQVLEAISRKMGFGGQIAPLPALQQQGAGGYNIFARNMRVSAAKARALGWTPQQPTVIDEIEHGSYQ
jgi:nucleoside-diphosphate-sugar epimerase